MPRPTALAVAKVASPLALGCACFFTPGTASAVGTEEPAAIGKGIFGGALIASELTLTIEAAVGVRPWWGYALGGGLAAIGGGVGGFFLADAAGPEVPTALLVSSLVLAVPTTIFVLSQTAYRPPPAEPLGDDVAFAESRMFVAPLPRVPSLIERDAQGRFALGVPAVNVSLTPTGLMGAQAGHAFEVPVFDLQFR
jgi:hypothetical protein